MLRHICFVWMLLVLLSASTFADDWVSGTEQSESPGTVSEVVTPSDTVWRVFQTDKQYLYAEAAVGVYPYDDDDYDTIEGTSKAGWGNDDNDMGFYTKKWTYTGCEDPIPYQSKGFTITAGVYWKVEGNSDNQAVFLVGKSSADAQTWIGINSEPDDEADNTSAGHWSGSKSETGSFQNVSLSISWPPSIGGDWDATADEWGDEAVQPETKTWFGDVSNETEGGTRLGTISVTIKLKSKAWAKGEGDCTGAVAHTISSIT